ncbi:MAG: UDP-N-acetylmuramate--L-alanine ligase [Planctomycetota bacterium]
MTDPRSLHHVRKVHCVGVGGAGMSGIARLMAARGVTVSGSDPVRTPLTGKLMGEGIRVDHAQDGRAIDRETSLVIASAAIRQDNAEMQRAAELRVPVIKYAEAVGRLMLDRAGIAVAGTHGKTTTSSMLAWIFSVAGRDPSFLIGGEPHNLGTNARHGHGPHFVVEACEYDRSFHRFDPVAGLITNIDADHLDYYGSEAAIRESFRQFAKGISIDGLLVANADNEGCREVMAGLKHREVMTFGMDASDAMWRPELTDANETTTRFRLRRHNWPVNDISLGVPGLQNVANATAAAALADWFGIDREAVAEALHTFRGVGRRFHLLGDFCGAPVVDDYAHHPVEIDATIRAARLKWPERQLWVVFQPHQAFRTQAFFDDFAEALATADKVMLLDIYAAREGSENPINRELSVRLSDAVSQLGTQSLHCEHMGDVISELRETVTDDVVVMTVGAGNVNEVAAALVRTKTA